MKKDIGRKLCRFYGQKVLTFCSSPVRKKKKMNKTAQNGRFHFFTKVLLSSPFNFIFANEPKTLPNQLLRLLFRLEKASKVVFS